MFPIKKKSSNSAASLACQVMPPEEPLQSPLALAEVEALEAMEEVAPGVRTCYVGKGGPRWLGEWLCGLGRSTTCCRLFVSWLNRFLESMVSIKNRQAMFDDNRRYVAF